MWGNLPRRARWIAAGFVVGFGEGACWHVYALWTARRAQRPTGQAAATTNRREVASNE